MKSVFVIWKDVEDSMWHPVAKLTRNSEAYSLNYTKGAEHHNFVPFPRMQDKNKVYVSIELFAFFRNRILPRNRPEFRKVLEWSDMTNESFDELDMLSITGGARQTDEFRIIAQPETSLDHSYKIRFYISGVRYLEDISTQRISRLSAGENLHFDIEDSNPYDSNAIVAMTTDVDKLKVGYCPKYFNCDIKDLIRNPSIKDYSLSVVRVNENAPPQYRLLCEFKTRWPEGFTPLMSSSYLAYNSHNKTAIE